MTQSDTRVLLIVSGGIAAYKAPELVRALVKDGCDVQVVMTPSAGAFVTELSLTTVSKRPVRTTLLDAAQEGRVGHIDLADWPDLVVVAPATANILARAACGMADDLATTCLLATRAPVLWAPAMNTNMWRHPATKANLAVLQARGAHFVGPDAGELACGWVGEGRMIDPELIAAAVGELASGKGRVDERWKGRKVLVSAGPTRAYLDPVRFLTNASTGAMGFAIAEVAAARGAEVTLVSGPVDRPTPPGCRRVHVQTADQMLAAMEEVLVASKQDLVAMVAAVSDLAPARDAAQKLTKDDLVDVLREGGLVRGVDVLATLIERHRDRGWFLGFAAQTVPDGTPEQIASTLRRAGSDKLAAKGCDALFVNRVGAVGTGFESATNTGLLLICDPAKAEPEVLDAGPPMPKPALAGWLLDRLAQARGLGGQA